jgi:hypothetical protein
VSRQRLQNKRLKPFLQEHFLGYANYLFLMGNEEFGFWKWTGGVEDDKPLI